MGCKWFSATGLLKCPNSISLQSLRKEAERVGPKLREMDIVHETSPYETPSIYELETFIKSNLPLVERVDMDVCTMEDFQRQENGAFKFSAPHMQCWDPVSAEGDSKLGIILGVVFGILAILIVGVCLIWQARKCGARIQGIFTRNTNAVLANQRRLGAVWNPRAGVRLFGINGQPAAGNIPNVQLLPPAAFAPLLLPPQAFQA